MVSALLCGVCCCGRKYSEVVWECFSRVFEVGLFLALSFAPRKDVPLSLETFFNVCDLKIFSVCCLNLLVFICCFSDCFSEELVLFNFAWKSYLEENPAPLS